MTNFKLVKFLIDISVYAVIIGVAYGPLPVGVAFAVLCFLYIFLVFRFRDMAILFPFYIYPFMFMLRARDPENFLLIICPELFALIPMVFHYIGININEKIGAYSLLLFFYAVSVALVVMFHVENIYYFPLMFRQYILPVFFVIFILDVTSKRNNLSFDALKISFNSFALVAVLSILNIFGVFTIDASIEALYPFLNYYTEGGEQQIGRTFMGSDIFPRLNLFSGGALGSSAAIFIALGLTPYLSKKLEMNWLHRFSSMFLLAAGAMSFSTSILIPVAIFTLFIFRTMINWYLAGFILFLSIFILANMTLFVSGTVFDYVYSTSMIGFASYLVNLNFWSILFGSGPRFTSSGFEFVPDNFIIDVGVFRIFVETGAISFIIFLFFLTSIFRKGFNVGLKSDAYGGRVFFFLFLIFVLMVHANMTALPPFYPLFAVVVGGIVRAYCLKIDKSARLISNY
jgi:hypothetical protein